jgi:hypothetical protein
MITGAKAGMRMTTDRYEYGEDSSRTAVSTVQLPSKVFISESSTVDSGIRADSAVVQLRIGLHSIHVTDVSI